MGLFKNLFGSKNDNEKKDGKNIPWISLTSLEQLEEIELKSVSRPQLIFKHSTTCGISRMVLNMFAKSYDASENQADFYFLDLHRHRQVSDGVSRRFKVTHQSPQVLILKNGTVVYHGSHGAITEIDLKAYL